MGLATNESHNDIIIDEIAKQLGLSRRDLLARGGFGLAGVVATSLVGCKTSSKASLATTPAQASTAKFLDDIELAERATPLPAPTDPAFGSATISRTIAVSSTIGRWLASKPYVMLQELLDQPSSFTVFKREIGPAIVFRHPHVIECLERTDEFTVEPYAQEMKAGTDGEYDMSKRTDFILGTDDESLYRPDAMLLRKVLSPDDQELLLRPMIAAACSAAVQGQSKKFDVVSTICRRVPVAIVSQYLGVHTYEENQDSFMPGVKGGGAFAIPSDLTGANKFVIKNGEVPDTRRMYEWVRGAFRNIFNNLSQLDPKYAQFRAEGRIATQMLSAYIHMLIKHYESKVYFNVPDLPDTMLVRLLKLQKMVKEGGGAALAAELRISEADLLARLGNDRIRANVFGTVVGGVVNPEEASARMIDSILRLKDGKYAVAGKSSYEDLKNAVNTPTVSSNDVIRRFALEALRLQPQGEVVIRKSQPSVTTIGGVSIPKGTLVFVAHAAAMRDKDVISNPMEFDVNRDEMLSAFEKGSDRPKEMPQSKLYLQHGYGRHKCLGRYASELTLVETLRTVVNLGMNRAGPLLMDADGLYAKQLLINV